MKLIVSDVSKGHILVVDDDAEIRDLLSTLLSRAGYQISGAEDGVEMFKVFYQAQVDLIILDINLPGDDGFSLCQQLRQRSDVPVIMLTASSDDMDQVIGLEIGADDYIAKPFNPRQLQARIKALLRRVRISQTETKPKQSRYIDFSGWRLDTVNRELVHNEHGHLELSGADFNLMQLFLEHANEVLDRDAISDALRGREASPLDRSIDVQVSRLRQRLMDNGKHPKLIKTIRGSGYILTSEISYHND
ncbi:response regulator transcription factor [Echinimonas agarilytica]|uniref:Response regulator transcription factor n=2 Tax=Echinimonas agarilytica TaxID=1215918 RepID=A0AA42B8H6_9GAMM|nr:response regulator transcription factor [Echinimonas agarilytica]MCM2680558.1 response regulator transcription factor [Echinimonas agarilytica]